LAECQRFRFIVCTDGSTGGSSGTFGPQWRCFDRPAHILKEHGMWINTAHARLAVDDRRGLRLNAARGTMLRAVKGTLWITIDNDQRDIVLDPGEQFAVDTDAPLFVMALGERATLDVCTEPPERRTPRPSWLAGPWLRRAGTVAQVALRRPAAA
jgi:hypothetical protein